MNLIFFAVFAACACFVNGLHHIVNRKLSTADENTIDDQNTIDGQNNSDEMKIDDEELDQKVEFYLNLNDNLDNINENATPENDDVKLEDKTFKYWPQIIIIKPMVNRPPFFGLGSLLPNIKFGPSHGKRGFKTYIKTRPTTPAMPTVKTIRPSSYTTFTTTTHHTFSAHRPLNKMDNNLPSPEAREHETDDEIAAQEEAANPAPEKAANPAQEEAPNPAQEEAANPASASEPETEATSTTESPLNELIPESPLNELIPESLLNELIPDTETQGKTETKSCTTPSGASGDCISVYNCQVLLDLVNKKDRTSQDIALLQKSQCGFEGSSPAVCCPKKQPEGNCYTPEGKLGQCISLYSCSHLANMLKPPVPSESIAYVQRSKCEGKEQYSVCCGPPPDHNIENPVPSGNCNSLMTAFPPDPRTECCGVDSRVGNKIVGGNATTVDQYPWLVMIEYVQGTVTKLLCGGVLISGKYVLTAGHCVAGQVLTIGTPKRVRLGEYDISKEGPDCAPVEAGGEDCTEGVTRVLIEKIIPHPEYNPVSSLKRNDIALLRLKETAPFTDFIRPICLPSKDLTAPQNVPANFALYAAGWGAVSDRKSYSNVKLHVELPYVSPEKCQPVYSFPGRSVPLWKAQMCAGGVTGKDSCKGDSGGPLMYENGRTYEVTGIVSFGPIPCGMEGVPGVYSKVYEYLDWIRSTITP